jgi:putative transposase
MPRIARAVATGFPHHVVQRGNNKQAVFYDEDDRSRYLSLLSKYSKKWDADILAYCLMSNHVHLMIRPQEDESLYKMMQGVTLCYTQHINRKHTRTGRLWESRYHSCIVDNEGYHWAVARYIEQNPVRARIAAVPEEYPYSSARSHFGLEKSDILCDDLFDEGQRKDYIGFVRGSIEEDELKDIRISLKTGRPLSSNRCLKDIEEKLARELGARPIGRPRKNAQ